MPDITINKLNDVYIQIVCDMGIATELTDYFKFRVPGYQFTPSYRNKQWDGYIRLFNPMNRKIYTGLLSHINYFAESNGYTMALGPGLQDPDPDVYSIEDAEKFFGKLDPHIIDSKTQKPVPITARDFQVKALQYAVNNKRQLFLSPTGSGKSLIIYAIIQWLQQNKLESGNEKILLLVPTTSLVEQMYTDFKEYSTKNSWDVERYCHRVYSGHTKDTKKQVVISTWQSMYKQNIDYLNQFKAIIVDEAHQAKAASIKNILESMTRCPYRFGTTGTIDDSETHKLILQGLLGQVQRIASTKELMDRQELASLSINCLSLNYGEKDCKTVKKMKYQEEISWLFGNHKRNQFIADLGMALPGNTLILVSYTHKHGHDLWKLLQDAAKETGKPVFYVYGDVDTLIREKVRKIVEKEATSIILATYGTFQLGVNIRNLNNIVFAAPSKSTIRVLQSIGRSLRIGEEKTTANLYDIVDNLKHGKKSNWAVKHFLVRLKLYISERFKVRSRQINFRET